MLVVRDLDAATRQVRGRAADPDRRGQPLVLPHRGLRAAVRPDHPVAHEVAVVAAASPKSPP